MKRYAKKLFQAKLIQKDINDAEKITEKNLESYLLNKNYWVHRKDIKLKTENNRLSVESNNKKPKYISFLEGNFNFNLPPKLETNINHEGAIRLKITGKVYNKMKVVFYLIEYNGNERLNTNRIMLNKQQDLRFHPETTDFRMALRIEGKGKFEINGFEFKIKDISEKIQLSMDAKRSLKDIKVACILDEFSTKSYSDVFKLIEITPHEWKQMLQKEKPDMLLVESAWKGIEGKWQYQIGKYNNNFNNYLLKQVLDWFNDHNIPTVFWNKEDPIHFEKFVETARLFDYVFTTDSRMVPEYKKRTNNDQVFALPFAANPLLHNPIHYLKPRKKAISFAGSYYANRHEDRKRDMEEMLDIAKDYSLEIFDRNYKNGEPINENFKYPDRFLDNIKGSLPYSKIDKAYKDYRLMLNVNSVKDSPTMFSRRVFEGLACGTPIISSYSKGIKKMFGNTVVMPDNTNIQTEIEQLLENDEIYRKRSIRGIREVFNDHTYKHRGKYILDLLSISYDNTQEGLTAVFEVDSKEEFLNALELFEKQTMYNKKALFIIDTFDGFEELLNVYNDVKIKTVLKDYVDRYNIEDLFETDYFTGMKLDLYYGKHYLEDLYHATLYSNAEIVGKSTIDITTFDIEKYEYEFVTDIIPDTAAFKVSNLKNISVLDAVNDSEKTIKHLQKYKGARLFSSDKFNFSHEKGKLLEV